MKRTLAAVVAMLLLLTCSVSAATFKLRDYSDNELRDIRKQINEHFSSHQRGDILYEDENVAMYYLGWKKEYSSYELGNTGDASPCFSDDTLLF